MLLDYYAMEKTVKVLAKQQHLNLVYEKDSKGPHTNGRNIYVPTPDPLWNHDQVTEWLGGVYHEIRHNWPEFRGCFAWNEKKQLSMDSFLGNIVNILEDFKIEYNKHDVYAGEKHCLSKSRQLAYEGQASALIGNLRAAEKAIVAQAKKAGRILTPEEISTFLEDRQKFEALYVWDLQMRADFQVDLVGLGTQAYTKLTPISKGYVDLLNNGDYTARVNVSFLDNEVQYELALDIIENVFKDDPEERKKESSEQLVEGAESEPKKAVIKWEDITYHDHGDRSYAPSSIDYTNHKKGKTYLPPSADQFDVVDLTNNRQVGNASCLESIQDVHTGNLDKAVIRLLQVYTRKQLEYGHKRGKLAARNLYRTNLTGEVSTKIFSQKTQKLSIDSAVTVLVDNSGSMSGEKYAHAARAAIMLNNAIGALSVPLEIIGFTSTWGKGRPVSTIYKSFNGRTQETLLEKAFSVAYDDMGDNADGESILWSLGRLVQRREKKKIMIVISDGCPSADREGDVYQFTKDVVSSIEQSNACEIYGIGIQDDNVKRIYKDNKVIKQASHLEQALLEIVRDKILT